ncbi:hypothetical protein SDJN02_25818, partial [Cucurbita argyrosperma subsp. argyrosperma]
MRPSVRRIEGLLAAAMDAGSAASGMILRLCISKENELGSRNFCLHLKQGKLMNYHKKLYRRWSHPPWNPA